MAQTFTFYEGSLVSSAYVVPKAPVLLKHTSASSQITLSEIHNDSIANLSSVNPDEEREDQSINEYDSDFEQEVSPPPKRVMTPKLVAQPEVELNQSLPPIRKKLHQFQGKMHPLLLGEHEHAHIDAVVGEKRIPPPKPKSSKAKQKTRKPESVSKKVLPALLPHQRKMESILHEIHHPPPSSQKRAPSLVHRPDIDQVSKLAAVIDDLKSKLKERDDEVKTLKIVNRRQDLAITRTDKSHQDFPKLLQHANEELRALKFIHATCGARISNAEKSSQEHIEETIKLRAEISKLCHAAKGRTTGIIDTTSNEDMEKLKKELVEKDEAVLELNKKIKHLESTNHMVVREGRLKASKLTKELDECQKRNKELSEKLEEKTRQIAAMSIYSMLHGNANPHAPDVLNHSSKKAVHVTQTTIRNPTKVIPQPSVHKPTLSRKTPNLNEPGSTKPNNDNIIRSWNLSQTPLPSQDNLLDTSLPAVSLEHVTPQQISKRLSFLQQSEETPVAIVARRYLLMQLTALGKIGRSPEPGDEMPVPPKETERPQKSKEQGEEEENEYLKDDLEFFTFEGKN
ncbi:hypothetical protein BCR33DRAFT_717582 [Rhizoclosmatium globosum]|uniref:Lebercilin domain-containing protein n=1 Tax=Rhizoclosmatium globosum TaxID=329046 RepID=A0A1Y2C915_9FUNG|nr:hypothetical protein BCR33DRAFT_717582 [Rhizoclosmatium globosum]|eukprot:ORY43354.1 hypothetical protein BCR33DRAFT_717582 [Rhizoclosmatium globosum]